MSCPAITQYNEPLTIVRDAACQTALMDIAPEGPLCNPRVPLSMENLLQDYKKGLQLLFRGYSSRVGINKTGNHGTFEDISRSLHGIDRASWLKLCSDFGLYTKVLKRTDARGHRIIASTARWYQLWSNIPLGFDNVVAANLSELESYTRGKNGIDFGKAAVCSGQIATVLAIPDDLRAPPILLERESSDGMDGRCTLPLDMDEILKIFRVMSGPTMNYMRIPEDRLGKALSEVAYLAIRRMVPAESLVQLALRSNTARAAFFGTCLPRRTRLRYKPAFRTLSDWPVLREWQRKRLELFKEHKFKYFGKFNHIVARVKEDWSSSAEENEVTEKAFDSWLSERRIRRNVNNPRFDPGAVYLAELPHWAKPSATGNLKRPFYNHGGLTLNKGDIVHILYRRSDIEQKKHLLRLGRGQIHPVHGPAGVFHSLERDPKNPDTLRHRDDDWLIGILLNKT